MQNSFLTPQLKRTSHTKLLISKSTFKAKATERRYELEMLWLKARERTLPFLPPPYKEPPHYCGQTKASGLVFFLDFLKATFGFPSLLLRLW